MTMQKKAWRTVRRCAMGACVAAALVLTALPARAQLPTAVIGNDIDELRTALAAEPENLGLRMRVAQRQLDLIRDASIKDTRKIVEDIETQIKELCKQQSNFIYPYKVLAQSLYRRGKREEVMQLIDEYAKVGLPDFDLRERYVQCLRGLANDPAAPQPEKLAAAAQYVVSWMDSDLAPSFGSLLGLFKAWVVDPGLRTELLRALESRVQAEPTNVSALVGYSSCLVALGRNESAWKVLQNAERAGLCDWASGSRHPLIHILQDICPEQRTPESIDGTDIQALREAADKFPKNAGLAFRAALALKSKAFTCTRFARAYGERIAKTTNPPPADLAHWQAEKAERETIAAGCYADALPYALRVVELNPHIETLPLVLGDLYYKLGRQDEAIAQLARGVEIVPYFADLREGLANIYKDKKDWKACAEQLVQICQRAACHTEEWEKKPQDSLLPKPRSSRDRMLVELMETKEAREPVIAVFTEAAAKNPRNPNLHTFLAMLHFFAGQKQGAITAMRKAEQNGMCGQRGMEHDLADLIAAREKW
jgi:tetratricopeptide (TPR) repeat protein